MKENPIDANFCTSCGAELPPEAVDFYADLIFNRYRARFNCPECDYFGEVTRHGPEPSTGGVRSTLE